jgi:peptidoglycan/xylan/chitin deacetylase (PgdA/CDA1 family)
VAITFDDLPAVSTTRRDIATHANITRKLLKTIASNRIPAIGFVNENKLYDGERLDQARVEFLKQWLAAGLELGNHTFSHPDLHRIPLAAFEDDLIRGETVTRRLLEEKGKRLRYFRHPFLHTGRDLETRRLFEQFIAARGYRVAPVTIDNSDWIFAAAYDRAAEQRNRALMIRVARAYVPYMERKFKYYERQSVQLFGREITQVLLLHANNLNADHLDSLVRMMKRRGYRFISLDDALSDAAFASPDTYTGAGGITWLHRWALTRGVEASFFQGEPTTPDFVMKLAGVTSE